MSKYLAITSFIIAVRRFFIAVLTAVYLIIFSVASFQSAVWAIDSPPEPILVDLNTASATELAKMMVGVGPAKAKAIVDYRRQVGGFKVIEELEAIKGIGEKTIEKNRDRLFLNALQ